MMPTTSSLVKYDNPVLISKNTDRRSKVCCILEELISIIFNIIHIHKLPPRAFVLIVFQVQTPRGGAVPAAKGPAGPIPNPPAKSKLPPVEAQKSKETEEILNSILPPREWSEGGQLWVQSVSSTPATRLDVINLQEKLDTSLQQRQARETGICPVRRELYSQCFGEKERCKLDMPN